MVASLTFRYPKANLLQAITKQRRKRSLQGQVVQNVRQNFGRILFQNSVYCPLGSGTIPGLHLSTSLDLHFQLFPDPMRHQQSQSILSLEWRVVKLPQQSQIPPSDLMKSSHSPQAHFPLHICPLSSFHHAITRHAINCFLCRRGYASNTSGYKKLKNRKTDRTVGLNYCKQFKNKKKQEIQQLNLTVRSVFLFFSFLNPKFC